MGNFNKKYIIREAESILQECNQRAPLIKNDKNQIIVLKIKNKKQKRQLFFWQICTGVLVICLMLAIYY